MERDTSKHEETGSESGPQPAADTEGKEPGGEVSRASAVAGLQNGGALIASGETNIAHYDQHEAAESTEQGTSSLRVSAGSVKMKHLGLPTMEHFEGQGDGAVHPVVGPGMLPPLNIRGDSGKAKEGISLKTAAITAISAGAIRSFRRSSAAMHIDLLRVFVPDMLINVSQGM